MSDDETLTHQDSEGRIRMVDVGDKLVTVRIAVAGARISMQEAAFDAIKNGQGPKGDVLQTAELAGIMAAKRTSDLIPLCHPLALTKAKVKIDADEAGAAFNIRAEVRTDGKTGVEMEALTAASVAALTIYDMAKALDKTMTISDIQLLKKSGGRSGDYHREDKA